MIEHWVLSFPLLIQRVASAVTHFNRNWNGPKVCSIIRHVDQILGAVHRMLCVDDDIVNVLTSLEECTILPLPKRRAMHNVVSNRCVVDWQISHRINSEKICSVFITVPKPRPIWLILLDGPLVGAGLWNPVVAEDVVHTIPLLGLFWRAAATLPFGCRDLVVNSSEAMRWSGRAVLHEYRAPDNRCECKNQEVGDDLSRRNQALSCSCLIRWLRLLCVWIWGIVPKKWLWFSLR